MRSSYCRVLAGVVRQAAAPSAQVPAAAAHDVQAAVAMYPPVSITSPSWLASLLLGQTQTAGSSRPLVPLPARHHISTSLLLQHSQPRPPPDVSPKDAPGDTPSSSAASASASISVPSSASSSSLHRQQLPRAKSPRHNRPPAAVPSKPPQPAVRSAKDKTSKVPGSKAAAASAAAKAGGQRPLPPEARQRLNVQLSHMALSCRAVVVGSRALPGPATIQATGFYIGHPIPRGAAEAVVQKLRSQPLGPGLTLAGVYPDQEYTLVILKAPGGPPTEAAPEAQMHEAAAAEAAAAAAARPPDGGTGGGATSAGGAAAAAAAEPAAAGGELGPGADTAGSGPLHEALVSEGTGCSAAAGSATAVTRPTNTGTTHQQVIASPACCMAVMLLDYGGVAFFNVPESLTLETLARVVGTALPPAKQAGLGLLAPPKRSGLGAGAGGSGGGGGGGGGLAGGGLDVEAWRRIAAETLHKEEQQILVDPAMSAGRGKSRWIRKMEDSLHISEWDSTNLESLARVLSQSAAIRFYNQKCEEMLERYETIMPLVEGEPAGGRTGLDRLMFWRSRLPLGDLRLMVFKSSSIRVRLYSGLGLREPPASTWESARHHAVWDALRQEFELDDRSDTLMDKTDLLKQSCLDLISANNESFTKRSELSIILLITMEIVISLTDLHSILSYRNVAAAVRWIRGGFGAAAAAGGSGTDASDILS